MKGRPTRVTLAQYRRILEVKKMRALVPRNKELAKELGLPAHTIADVIHKGLKTYDLALAKEKKR